MKTESHKSKLVEQIKKTPIIQIACEKTGVSRATYYRWRKLDAKFREESDQALLDGAALVNDMAESQLISAIRSQNMTAIIFWLKHHHKDYKTRIEVSGKIKTVDEILTPEQQELIKKAIKMASFKEISNNLTQEL